MTLDVVNLSHSFGSVHALRDICASAGPGRLTALLGPNASGKSTLLRCIAGAIRPSSGAVRLADKTIAAYHPRELAHRLAYVPQRASVSAAFTVREVVELGRYVLPRSDAHVAAALESMDLKSLADRTFATLSVGQQQRVTVARALAQLQPEGCLVLDEPTAAMDLQFQRLTVERLRSLAKEGATVIMAIHDISLAAAVADDVWILRDGALTAAGGVDEVMEASLLESVFAAPFDWVVTPGGRRLLLPMAP